MYSYEIALNNGQSIFIASTEIKEPFQLQKNDIQDEIIYFARKGKTKGNFNTLVFTDELKNISVDWFIY